MATMKTASNKEMLSTTSFMMETLRDTAFGKLIRIFTARRVLRYPEEIDSSICGEYLHDETKIEDLEAATSHEIEEDPFFGMYALMSQASRSSRSSSRRISTASTVRGPAVIDWRGLHDSENPKCWSIVKKLFVSSLIWLLSFGIYIGSSIYTPGTPGVMEEFGVSRVAATLGLTVFVAGYGVGPMIWSPLSELPSIGRSPTYIFTLVVFVFFQFGVIYAKNFGMLLAFRFLTGFVGSPALATGGASMVDMWSPRVSDYMIAIWAACSVAAPVLGPVVGGFAFSAEDWTWTMWELMWVSGFILVLLFFFLPETYGPNILSRRARRVRRITGDMSYLTQAELALQKVTINVGDTEILFEATIRPFELCFREPIILVLNIYTSLIYGILYIWFEAFPIVFGEIHGFNPGEIGLSFLGILATVFCVTVPGYFIYKYFYQSRHFDKDGLIAPERQLPPSCVGAFSLPISLFWFGWTGNFESVHWIVPIIGSGFFGMGSCLIFNAVFCYLGHAYPRYAASVLAGNDFLRSLFGAGFPLFAAAMFHNLGVGWACTLLGCLAVFFVPYPFLLWKYGRRIRMASRYARHDL